MWAFAGWRHCWSIICAGADRHTNTRSRKDQRVTASRPLRARNEGILKLRIDQQYHGTHWSMWACLARLASSLATQELAQPSIMKTLLKTEFLRGPLFMVRQSAKGTFCANHAARVRSSGKTTSLRVLYSVCWASVKFRSPAQNFANNFTIGHGLRK